MGYAARRFVYLAGPFAFLAGCLSCPALSYCLPACLLASALALHEHFLPFCLIASCLLQMALALTLNGEALKKKRFCLAFLVVCWPLNCVFLTCCLPSTLCPSGCLALSFWLPACVSSSALALHGHFWAFCLFACRLLQMALTLSVG